MATNNRCAIFKDLVPYFGRVVPAKFIQRTSESIPEIARIHNLIEGIYKPAESEYALTIASMLVNPYADRIEFNSDRSWYFFYSPKAGSLDSAVNRSLFKCMDDNEPLLVIKQLSDKTHVKGTRYKILGLGLIDEFDQTARLFKIREVTMEAFQQRVDPSQILKDEWIETALQLEALEAWTPFVAEDRPLYRVTKVKRDNAFRKIILENYESTCAVSRSKFVHNSLIEAQAAHIISKEVNGTDDPRNGIALSHTTHWAFDRGIFTITDQYDVLIHPKAFKSIFDNFGLIEMNGRKILLPCDEANLPHPEALRWHKAEVFGKFLE